MIASIIIVTMLFLFLFTTFMFFVKFLKKLEKQRKIEAKKTAKAAASFERVMQIYLESRQEAKEKQELLKQALQEDNKADDYVPPQKAAD